MAMASSGGGGRGFGGGGRDHSGRDCFNCGEVGHISKNCPNPRKSRQGGGRSAGGGGFGDGGIGSGGGGGEFGGGLAMVADLTGGGGFGESTGEVDGDQKPSPLECCICMEKYNREREIIPKMLNCGHTLCDECIEKMIKNNQLKCPTCRQVPIASQNGFPTNFTVLHIIDEEETRAEKKSEEETRAKSFRYNCSDCSEGLTTDTALICKLERNHTGVICTKCYSTNHGDHGGIDSLYVLVNAYRPIFDRALERVKEKYEEYKEMESYFDQHQITSTADSWSNRLISVHESVAPSMDILRTEIDGIKRILDEDDSRLLETLIVSRRIGSFLSDFFGNAECFCDLEVVRVTFEFLMAAEETFKTKAAYNRYFPTTHTLRPYLELLEPMAVGDGSGDHTHGADIAGTSSSTNTAPFNRPVQTQTQATGLFTAQDLDGEGTSGQGEFGMMARRWSRYCRRGRSSAN